MYLNFIFFFFSFFIDQEQHWNISLEFVFQVLPVSLAQIFQLHFNLRFPTATSFDKVQPLLGVCLAALYPLTLPEIFYSVNSLNTNHFVSWEDFLQRFKVSFSYKRDKFCNNRKTNSIIKLFVICCCCLGVDHVSLFFVITRQISYNILFVYLCNYFLLCRKGYIIRVKYLFK